MEFWYCYLVFIFLGVLVFSPEVAVNAHPGTGSGNELRITNWCPFPVWPGVSSDFGSEIIENGGFELQPTITRTFEVSPNWSGTIWGRTGCTLSNDKCVFVCDSGDCGLGLCCRSKLLQTNSSRTICFSSLIFFLFM